MGCAVVLLLIFNQDFKVVKFDHFFYVLFLGINTFHLCSIKITTMNLFHYIMLLINCFAIIPVVSKSLKKKDTRTGCSIIIVFFVFQFLIIGSAYYGSN